LVYPSPQFISTLKSSTHAEFPALDRLRRRVVERCAPPTTAAVTAATGRWKAPRPPH
jgi:hypothetical protein